MGKKYTVIGETNKILDRFLNMKRYRNEGVYFIVSEMYCFKYIGPFFL